MFTGIVQKVGSIVAVRPGSGSRVLIVDTSYDDLELGESVAVNGVCLTVAALPKPGQPEFFVSPETLSRTNLGRLKPGSRANLERALTLRDRLSGHFVQGHVDGIGSFLSARALGESHEVRIEIPEALRRYVVEKGSIALNGVSLTVNQWGESGVIDIMLIPHTWTQTSFSDLKPGDPVNIEVDMLAKYVESLCPNLKNHPA